MTKIIYVTNSVSRQVVDGGTNREEALARFFSERGASRLVVQDEQFRGSKLGRVMRLRRLMQEVRDANPDIVVLNYPAYPFFWQHKVTVYYWMALVFARLLRRWADSHNARVVIDVMDLPVFQFRDLGYALSMSEKQFQRFDRAVLRRAHYLWVCSHSLAGLTSRTYGVADESITVVVNGCTPRPLPCRRRPDGVFRFFHSGSMDRARGIEDMLNAFIAARVANAELHLAGCNGEWIDGRFPASQVVYHGSLSDSQAATLGSTCDVGLIYYPQRGYYHYAFATKLAHYVSCGLPVLCTNVGETGQAVRSLGVGKVADIAQFGEAMREMAEPTSGIAEYASAVRDARVALSWEALYSAALERLWTDK